MGLTVQIDGKELMSLWAFVFQSHLTKCQNWGEWAGLSSSQLGAMLLFIFLSWISAKQPLIYIYFQKQFVGSTYILILIFSNIIGGTYGQRMCIVTFDIVFKHENKEQMKTKYIIFLCCIQFLCDSVQNYINYSQQLTLFKSNFYIIYLIQKTSFVIYQKSMFILFLIFLLFSKGKNLLI